MSLLGITYSRARNSGFRDKNSVAVNRIMGYTGPDDMSTSNLLLVNSAFVRISAVIFSSLRRDVTKSVYIFSLDFV